MLCRPAVGAEVDVVRDVLHPRLKARPRLFPLGRAADVDALHVAEVVVPHEVSAVEVPLEEGRLRVAQRSLSADRRLTPEEAEARADVSRQSCLADVVSQDAKLAAGAEGEQRRLRAVKFGAQQGGIFVRPRAPLEDAARRVARLLEAPVLERDVCRQPKLHPLLEALAEREGERVAQRACRLLVVGERRGGVISVRVARVDAGVFRDKPAAEVLIFYRVDHAGHGHKHLVGVRVVVFFFTRRLRPAVRRRGVGLSLLFPLLCVQLADLLLPLVALAASLGLSVRHLSVEAQVVSVRQEEVAAAQAVVRVGESRGERFTVHSPSPILKVVRVCNISVVRQAAVLIGYEVQVTHMRKRLVAVSPVAPEESIREQLIVVRGVLSAAIRVIEVRPYVHLPPEVTRHHPPQLLLPLRRSARTGVKDVGVRHLHVVEIPIRRRDNLPIEGISKDEVACFAPFAKDPRLIRCPDVRSIRPRHATAFHQRMISRIDPVGIHLRHIRLT